MLKITFISIALHLLPVVLAKIIAADLHNVANKSTHIFRISMGISDRTVLKIK